VKRLVASCARPIARRLRAIGEAPGRPRAPDSRVGHFAGSGPDLHSHSKPSGRFGSRPARAGARCSADLVTGEWHASLMGMRRQPLFDEIDRTDPTPANHQESSYEFMNRIAGEYWEHPRMLMQQWLDHVQRDGDYIDLRQRFRSRDDEQFRSAFLELYIHEILLRAGYTVTIHPMMSDTTSRPDFLAERDDKRLYVEAIVPGTNPAAKAAAQRRAVLFDTVNQLGDPNFMLWLDHLVEGSDPPAATRLRTELRRWLSHVDPDAPWDLQSAPALHWQHNGWSATFKAIPKKPEARGRHVDSRAIGVYGHTGVTWIDDAPAIRKALTRKHHEYGDLDAPFIIAVGTYIQDTDRWHSTNAMYGASAIELNEHPDGEITTRAFRRRDGYFGGPPHWQHPQVSGVLLVNQLMPYHVHRAEVTLWRHPKSAHALPDDLGLPCLTLALDGDRVTDLPPSMAASDFFGLPEQWPPGEAWPDHQ